MSETTLSLYYAEDGKVWKRPITTENDDGSTSISIGFPVCTMHDAVGKDAAYAVAKLMNDGHAWNTRAPDDAVRGLVEALEAIIEADTYLEWTGGPESYPIGEAHGKCAEIAIAALARKDAS